MKRVTIVVSDLHMGDGSPGDDFVDDKNQFATFLREQLATPEGADGQIELIINGDFLEFVQVGPEYYRVNSDQYWCTEQESLLKLHKILDGHPEVFKALREFQEPGNLVTLFAGNHDIDLYWKDIQEAIRAKAGDKINFELGEVWYSRYGGRLQISHGHLIDEIDPANGFQHWDNPKLNPPGSLNARLEMCPGTIFVVRFVNLLEAKYPFADNLHPETAIVNVLWREDRWGLKAVAWAFGRFMRQFPAAFLSTNATSQLEDIGKQLEETIAVDSFVRDGIAELYRDALGEPSMTAGDVRSRLNSEDKIEEFIANLIASGLSWDRWISVLSAAAPSVNSTKLDSDAPNDDVLAIRAAGKIDTAQACLNVARERAAAQKAQVIVLGHTHLPQDIREGTMHYCNPGSWTRYIDAKGVGSLKLEDLANEKTFPYQLNYVRVEDTGEAALNSSFHKLPD
jgi:UDP-2,3-diacylglucosamine pyrophosphatase LpxH